MKVLKFGGTSVGSPERMRSLKELVVAEEQRIIVLSALSGTTNTLVELSEAYKQKDTALAKTIIENLFDHYVAFIEALFSIDSFKNKASETIEDHFALLRSFSTKPFSIKEEREILAQGELMSTKLFHTYLTEQNVESIFLNAFDFMCIDENDEPVLNSIEKQLKAELNKYPKNKLFITQGYICLNSNGEIDNLKRGGSDYTASLIGAATQSDEVQIWTDIDGMHNNDPRFVEKTFPVAELTFDEAAELAYFGAKILHPATVLPAKKANVPVRIKNTMNPDAPGTLISKDAPKSYIKSIAAKDNIIAINIKSSRMLLAHGFLKSVFEVFERYKTSIDMITTSEVAISLTIDNDQNIKPILEEIQQYATTTVDTDQSIICIVGDFLSTKPGVIERVIVALKAIPIRMISYGGSENNISLLINTTDKKQALNLLNQGVFEN